MAKKVTKKTAKKTTRKATKKATKKKSKKVAKKKVAKKATKKKATKKTSKKVAKKKATKTSVKKESKGSKKASKKASKKSKGPFTRKISSHRRKMSKYYAQQKPFKYVHTKEEFFDPEKAEDNEKTVRVKFLGHCPECYAPVTKREMDTKTIFICYRCNLRTRIGNLLTPSDAEALKKEDGVEAVPFKSSSKVRVVTAPEGDDHHDNPEEDAVELEPSKNELEKVYGEKYSETDNLWPGN